MRFAKTKRYANVSTLSPALPRQGHFITHIFSKRLFDHDKHPQPIDLYETHFGISTLPRSL